MPLRNDFTDPIKRKEKELNEAQVKASLTQNLYYYIGQRSISDWSTNPGTAVLLTIITCGIYGLYLFYKLFERRDQHFARVSNMAYSATSLLMERAKDAGKENLVAAELQELELIGREFNEMSGERGAVLWLLLAILTGGIGTLVGYYILMDDFARHDALEARFFTLMSSALAKIGLASGTSLAQKSIPERNFLTFLLLSFVTCGIYSFYWLYVLILDGNSNFENQVQWEDFLYKALAAA